MTTELLQSQDCAVAYVPSRRPASSGHTLAVVDPSGVSQAAPTVTVDSVGSAGTVTIATVTNPTTWVLDSVMGVEPGRRLWWQPAAGQGSVVTVSTVAGTTVTLEGAPAGQPAIGDTLHGCTLRATVPASALGTRGLHWSLRWTWTDTDGHVTTEQQAAHVVRQRFAPAVTPERAAAEFGRWFPAETRRRETGYFRELAERANDRVRRTLMAKGQYPHYSGDPGAFVSAGRMALVVELAHEGLRAPGYQGVSLEDIEKSCRRAVYEAADSLHWSDGNDDGVVQPAEIARPIARAMRLRR